MTLATQRQSLHLGMHRQVRYLAMRREHSWGSIALEGAVLTLSFVGALFASANWPHPVFSLVALANYIWLCTLFFRIEPRGAVLVLPQLINSASTMVALVMIEYGGEMFELGLVGRPGPWSSEMNLCNLMFCAGVVTVVKPLLTRFDARGSGALSPTLDRFANLLAASVLALVCLVAIAMIVRGLQFGFPLLAGTDRFAFRRFAADKVTLYALNLKFVLGYALGFVAFIVPATRMLRIGGSVAFWALACIYFLFGEKFFTQLAFLSAFFAPYLFYNYRQVGRRLWAYSAAGLLALTVVMTVTTYIYSKGFTETGSATTKRLSGRIVGQGELWFLQASIGGPAFRWNGLLIDRYTESLNVKAIDLFAVQKSLGPNYFSNGYAPDYLRTSLQKNAGSVTYTQVTEAMGLVLFGWIGLGAMMFLMGALLGLASTYIVYAIVHRSILSCFFAAYVYLQLRNAIVQATPWVIGSVYSLRWLAIILVIELTLLVVAKGSGSSGVGHNRSPLRQTRGIKPPSKPPIQGALDEHVDGKGSQDNHEHHRRDV
jgi:hypothetical protein